MSDVRKRQTLEYQRGYKDAKRVFARDINVPNKDLISRQDAKEALVEYAKFLWDRFHEHCNLAGMLDAIDNVPPVRETNGEKKDED